MLSVSLEMIRWMIDLIYDNSFALLDEIESLDKRLSTGRRK
jgi:hypothetical protein